MSEHDRIKRFWAELQPIAEEVAKQAEITLVPPDGAAEGIVCGVCFFSMKEDHRAVALDTRGDGEGKPTVMVVRYQQFPPGRNISWLHVPGQSRSIDFAALQAVNSAQQLTDLLSDEIRWLMYP